jgi:hypothetical protein
MNPHCYAAGAGTAGQSRITDYIGSARYERTCAEAPPFPQAFLVEKPGGAGTRIHFHDEDQFQIFVSGSGRIGPDLVVAPAVHFANYHTAYGPIAADDGGIAWFTLRDVADEGAWFLPEDRGHAERGATRRNLSLNLSPLGTPGLVALCAPTDDGLAVWRMGVNPHEQVGAGALPPFPPGAGGRFHVVLAGSVEAVGETLVDRSLLYATAAETVTMTAGAAGADILILQFPRDRRDRTAAVRSDIGTVG